MRKKSLAAENAEKLSVKLSLAELELLRKAAILLYNARVADISAVNIMRAAGRAPSERVMGLADEGWRADALAASIKKRIGNHSPKKVQGEGVAA